MSLSQWEEIYSTTQQIPPRSGHTLIYTNNKIWLFGGQDTLGITSSDLYLGNISITEKQIQWSKINTEIEYERDLHSAVNCDNDRHIIVFGGNEDEIDIPKRDNTMIRFDLEKKDWEFIISPSKKTVPLARKGHTAVVDHSSNEMIIFGGKTLEKNIALCDTFKLSLANLEWSKLFGSSPSARSGHSAVIHNRTMFIFGGVDMSNNYLNDLHALNLEQQIWTEIQCHGEIPRPRERHSAVIRNNPNNGKIEMIIFDGWTYGSSKDHQLFILDIDSKKWRQSIVDAPSSLPFVTGHTATMINDSTMMVVGGSDRKFKKHSLCGLIHLEKDSFSTSETTDVSMLGSQRKDINDTVEKDTIDTFEGNQESPIEEKNEIQNHNENKREENLTKDQYKYTTQSEIPSSSFSTQQENFLDSVAFDKINNEKKNQPKENEEQELKENKEDISLDSNPISLHHRTLSDHSGSQVPPDSPLSDSASPIYDDPLRERESSLRWSSDSDNITPRNSSLTEDSFHDEFRSEEKPDPQLALSLNSPNADQPVQDDETVEEDQYLKNNISVEKDEPKPEHNDNNSISYANQEEEEEEKEEKDHKEIEPEEQFSDTENLKPDMAFEQGLNDDNENGNDDTVTKVSSDTIDMDDQENATFNSSTTAYHELDNKDHDIQQSNSETRHHNQKDVKCDNETNNDNNDTTKRTEDNQDFTYSKEIEEENFENNNSIESSQTDNESEEMLSPSNESTEKWNTAFPSTPIISIEQDQDDNSSVSSPASAASSRRQSLDPYDSDYDFDLSSRRSSDSFSDILDEPEALDEHEEVDEHYPEVEKLISSNEENQQLHDNQSSPNTSTVNIQEVIDRLDDHNNQNIESKESLCIEIIQETIDKNNTELNFGGLGLRQLPKRLLEYQNQLNHITSIDLSHNNLSVVPEWFFSMFKDNVIIDLDLSHNTIFEIPEQLNQFYNMEELNLSNNRVEYVPKSMLELDSLKFLNLSHNSLVVIPENICRMEKLIEFDVSHNDLINLPSRAILQLSELEHFEFEGNKLLKSEISSLKKLKKFTKKPLILTLDEEDDRSGEHVSSTTQDSSNTSLSPVEEQNQRQNETDENKSKTNQHQNEQPKEIDVEENDTMNNHQKEKNNTPNQTQPLQIKKSALTLKNRDKSETRQATWHTKKQGRRESRLAKMLRHHFSFDSEFTSDENSLSETETARVNILLEFLGSERKYVDYIRILKTWFYDPLVRQSTEVLPQEVAQELFPDSLLGIYNANTQLLQDIDGVLINYADDPIGLAREAIVSNLYSRFDVNVYLPYVSAYERCISAVRKALQEYPAFKKYANQVRKKPECDELELPALLVMPVQRIPRYKLLLESLLKKTPKEHPDYVHLINAISTMSSAAETQNSHIKESNNKRRLYELEDELQLQDLHQNRRFIREGNCKIKDNNSSKKSTLFLFNDLVIISRRGKTRKRHIKMYSVAEINVVNKVSKSGGRKGELRIQLKDKKVLLEFKDILEAEKWNEAFKSCTHGLQRKSKSSEIPSMPKKKSRLRFF